MSDKSVIDTLYEFLVRWFEDKDFREEHDNDVEKALEYCGFDDVEAADLLDALPLVAEELSLGYQQSIYDYMETVATSDAASDFAVVQGGGEKAVSAGAPGHDGAAATAAATTHHEESLEEVARHIYNIQHITEHNTSYIDDRDVVTTVTAAGEGDVYFDQDVAGDGAIVAEDSDLSGVNTGENSGFIAGDDIEDVEITDVSGDDNIVTGDVYDSNLVKGDGNTTVGDVSGAATILSGDDAVFAQDSNVIDGDFEGIFVGDGANGANFGTAYDLDADDSALNFGDGTAVQDNSVNDSGNTTVKDSYDTEDSYNTDASTNLDVKVKDSLNDNSDNSTNDSYKVKDSLNDESDNSTNVDVEDSFTEEYTDKSDNSTNVDLEDSFTKDYDVDVELDDSFTDDDTYTTDTDIDADVDVIDDRDGLDIDDVEVAL